MALPRKMWKTVRWREGSKGDLVSRFAAVRVRPSHRDYWRAEPRPEEWLLIEWPEVRGRAADRDARRHGKAALAHRARLLGFEAGDRPRSL